MEKNSSSMQLTRGADYAIRVMVYMANLPEQERSLLPDLARAIDAPVSFLSKVLQALCKAELIASRRGQRGGFEMLEAGRKASMRKVVEAIDGPISLNLCLRCVPGCNRKEGCASFPIWAQAQAAMMQVLDHAIIADIAQKQAAQDSTAVGCAGCA